MSSPFKGLSFDTRPPNREQGEGWCTCRYPATTVLEINSQYHRVAVYPLCVECLDGLWGAVDKPNDDEPPYGTHWTELPHGGRSCYLTRYCMDLLDVADCKAPYGDDCKDCARISTEETT